MDAGQCIEFGAPYELLLAKTGPRIFQGMVKEGGRVAFVNAKKIARLAFYRKTETTQIVTDIIKEMLLDILVTEL